MSALAYYNEHDPKAAAWLRELIKEGHIAHGHVDERDIRDVLPSDLAEYRQCHFFAGIGGWSLALRLAGVPDDAEVWTGSCPCQPFSAAGRGGGFDDERHLWPAFHHLIRECRPPVVLGEQVASKDGLGWLDLVRADLEGEGYAVGASDLCAAGVGAPHIRQRLWWVGIDTGKVGDGHEAFVAISNLQRREHVEDRRSAGIRRAAFGAGEQRDESRDYGAGAGWLADAGGARRQQVGGSALGDEAAHGGTGRHGIEQDRDHVALGDVEGCGMADAHGGQRGRLADGEGRLGDGAKAGRIEGDREPASGVVASVVADAMLDGHEGREPPGSSGVRRRSPDAGGAFVLADSCGAGSPSRKRGELLGADREGDGRAAEQPRGASAFGMADASGGGREPREGDGRVRDAHDGAGAAAIELRPSCALGGLADSEGGGAARFGTSDRPAGQHVGDGTGTDRGDGLRDHAEGSVLVPSIDNLAVGPGRSFRRPDAHHGGRDTPDWLFCRDGKWRPVVGSHVSVVDGIPSGVADVRPGGDGEAQAHPEAEEGEGEGVDGTTGHSVRSEVLPIVRDVDGAQNVLRETGGQVGLRKADLLRQDVHGVGHGGRDEGSESSELPEAVREDGESVLRGMPEAAIQASRPSRGPESYKQRPIELDHLVRILPSQTALAELRSDHRTATCLFALQQAICEESSLPCTPFSFEEAWESLGEEAQDRIRMGFEHRFCLNLFFPLAAGQAHRVGLLRGYGNAIVPEVAQAFIESVREALP